MRHNIGHSNQSVPLVTVRSNVSLLTEQLCIGLPQFYSTCFSNSQLIVIKQFLASEDTPSGDSPKRRYDIPVLSGSAYVGQVIHTHVNKLDLYCTQVVFANFTMITHSGILVSNQKKLFFPSLSILITTKLYTKDFKGSYYNLDVSKLKI